VVLYVQQVQRLLQITTPPLVVITGRQSVLPSRPSSAPQPPPGCGAFLFTSRAQGLGFWDRKEPTPFRPSRHRITLPLATCCYRH